MKTPDVSKIFGAAPFVSEAEFAALRADAEYANALLHTGEGAGSDFLGWVGLPSSVTAAQIAEIKAVAEDLRAVADVVVVIGIGGSYLGAKALLEALQGFPNYRPR